uniref:Uncharacterized protein n=1 Tax=Anopheles culicifacies TaxID=139723 RepID=A0A182M3M7_9DIPT
MRLFKAKKLLDGPQALARGSASPVPVLSPAEAANNATYNDIIVLAGSTPQSAQTNAALLLLGGSKFEPELPEEGPIAGPTETPPIYPCVTDAVVPSVFNSPNESNQHPVEPPMAPIPHAASTDNVCSINNASSTESSHVRNQGVEARLMRDQLRPRTPPPGTGHCQPTATIARNGIGKFWLFWLVL